MMPTFHERNDWFVPLLVISAALHILAITFWKLSVQPRPQFSIQQAVSSVEVRLIKERPQPTIPPVVEPVETITPQPRDEKIIPEKEILTQENSIEEIPVKPVIEEKNAPVEESLEAQGAVVEPKPLEYINQAPVYPFTARRKGWEGIVYLLVHVDVSGHPVSVVIERTSGYEDLDKAAIRAVGRWKFEPAQHHGKAVAASVSLPIQFKLTN